MRLKIAWLATEQSVSSTVTRKWHTGYGGPSNGSEWQNMAIESEVKIYENHRKDARYDEKTICPTIAAHYGTGGGNVPFVIEKLRVRKLTPIECERLQGFPSVITFEYEIMTRDELIAIALANKDVLVDAETGKVYRTRGPGGIHLKEPVELKGSNCNGYLVATMSAREVKKQVRLHRVVWIAQHGIPPEGYVVDHINNDKTDNRIANLQLLKAEENSTKARRDGLYLVGEDSPRAKLTVELKEKIFFDYYSGGGSYTKLAMKYGVSKSRIAQIVKENDYTQIPWKGKPAEECPDSPRYKAIGNSWAVPCVRWIGKRIQAELEKNK